MLHNVVLKLVKQGFNITVWRGFIKGLPGWFEEDSIALGSVQFKPSGEEDESILLVYTPNPKNWNGVLTDGQRQYLDWLDHTEKRDRYVTFARCAA